MIKTSIFTILSLILIGCIEAPNNERKGSDKPKVPREPTSPSCPTCSKASGHLPSMIFRVKGSAQLTYTELTNLLLKNKLPKEYQLIPTPSLNTDDQTNRAAKDGYKDCGNTDVLNSIDSRINHCFNIHNKDLAPGELDKSFWSAKINGISGEADWKLVLRDKDKDATLWINTRTGLIWSHKLHNTSDWNEASGFESKFEKSVCSSLEDITGDHVNWRLPNRNEFLLADISGARFVLNDLDTKFWTASSVSGNTAYAWVINQSNGILSTASKQYPLDVRCIGEVVK